MIDADLSAHNIEIGHSAQSRIPPRTQRLSRRTYRIIGRHCTLYYYYYYYYISFGSLLVFFSSFFIIYLFIYIFVFL